MRRILGFLIVAGSMSASDTPKVEDLTKQIDDLKLQLEVQTQARQYWRYRAEEIMQNANVQIYTLGAQRAQRASEDLSQRFQATCVKSGKTFNVDATTGEPGCIAKPEPKK